MSGASSKGAAWSGQLEPARPYENVFQSADDPRLGEIIERWRGDAAALRPGRAVLIGFPQDDGVRRNHGRPGAAQGPHEIRRWLYRLTPWDAESDIDLSLHPPLDLGDVRISGSLEDTQGALGDVVGGVLQSGAVPLVLGGGHETAYGHYLGYLAAGLPVGIINTDAHLDVRPVVGDLGHSGTPFRQALEHPTSPLAAGRYVCLGAQPHCTSQQHWLYLRDRGCRVLWRDQLPQSAADMFSSAVACLSSKDCHIYVTIDADVVNASEVPGVSAPNALGLTGDQVLRLAREAGQSHRVASFDLVEICPPLDPDGRSARWGALAAWHFLIGMAGRQ